MTWNTSKVLVYAELLIWASSQTLDVLEYRRQVGDSRPHGAPPTATLLEGRLLAAFNCSILELVDSLYQTLYNLHGEVHIHVIQGKLLFAEGKTMGRGHDNSLREREGIAFLSWVRLLRILWAVCLWRLQVGSCLVPQDIMCTTASTDREQPKLPKVRVGI